jgi:putative transposase
MPAALDCHAPGHPLHLIQRGYCRAACFIDERDRLAYLHWLTLLSGRIGCAVHAYVLMGNHVHLLLTPSRTGGATRLMRSLAECFVPEARERGGPLWEERFETWAVFPRQYLLACMRYIELNPVRAGLVARAADYRWSSYRANALGEESALVTPHPFYCALGRSSASRQAQYQAMFRSSITARSSPERS